MLGCGNGAAAAFVEGNSLYVYGWNGKGLVLPHDCGRCGRIVKSLLTLACGPQKRGHASV